MLMHVILYIITPYSDSISMCLHLFLGHSAYSNDKHDRTWKEVIVT